MVRLLGTVKLDDGAQPVASISVQLHEPVSLKAARIWNWSEVGLSG